MPARGSYFRPDELFLEPDELFLEAEELFFAPEELFLEAEELFLDDDFFAALFFEAPFELLLRELPFDEDFFADVLDDDFFAVDFLAGVFRLLDFVPDDFFAEVFRPDDDLLLAFLVAIWVLPPVELEHRCTICVASPDCVRHVKKADRRWP